jgi:RimJ/RimL family protein N-acetyltransferase
MRTDRLLLRRWDPADEGDVAAAYDVYRRPEVARWLGATPQPWPSRGVGRARLERWAAIAAQRPGYGMWAVVPDFVGTPVGTVLLVPLPDAAGTPTDDVEIGWHFHPDHWGRGYATEAAKAVLSHAFTELGLARVNAVAYAENAASFGVMRRLGMTRQGDTDRWYGTTFEWWACGPEVVRG